MICNKCHVHVEDGTTVCPVCGAAIEPEVTDLEVQEATSVEVEETPETVAEELQEVEAEADNCAEIPVELEPAPVKKKLWVKVTAIVACLALVLGLGAMVWYGVNGSLAPRANDIYYKKQYNADDNKAVNAANTVIATMGSKELTNAQFQVFYWMGYYTFLQEYGSYLSYFGLDLNQPLSEQYVQEGGATWEQFFVQSALENWHNYQSLLLYAEKDGYVVSDSIKQQIDAVISDMEEAAASYDLADAEAVVQADMGPAANLEGYRNYLELYYGGMEYFEGLYDQVDPSNDEISAYFEKNADALKSTYGVDKESGKLIDVRHILLCPKGGTKDELGQTTYSQKEWDDCLAEAEALLKKWQDGEATEASFALLAGEFTEDPGSQSTGGLYDYVYEGKMVPAFNDWCFDESRQYGDTGIVQTNYGYHIMYFVYGEEGWFRRAKDALITDACTAVMERAMEEFPIEVNFKKIVLGRLGTEE